MRASRFRKRAESVASGDRRLALTSPKDAAENRAEGDDEGG